MANGDEDEIIRSLEPGLLDADDGVIIPVEHWAVALRVAGAAGDDPERAGRDDEIPGEPRPIEDHLPGGAGRELRQQPHLRHPPGQIGPLIRRPEHHHPFDPVEIGGRCVGHPPADDDVPEAVADEADPVGAVEPRDHTAEGAGVIVDPRPRTGVAECQHRGIVMLAEIVGQRAHRSTPLPQAVEKNHRRAVHRGNLSGGFERLEVLPAGSG